MNCLEMFDPMEDVCSVEIDEVLPIPSRCAVPLSTPSQTPRAYTSASIKRSLLHDQQHYRVQPNSSSRASAQCWKVFGFPSKMKDENSNEFTLIPGFASCKTCFETYKYMDSSTGNLNSHQCSRTLPSDQHSLASFVQSPSRSNGKLVLKKKEEIKKLCVRWIASSMRPFQIVSDPGLRQIVQASMNIGLYLSISIASFTRFLHSLLGRDLRSECGICADDLLPCDRTVKNELDKMAQEQRKVLKQILLLAAENNQLSISPDNWSDNHRKISYMGATVHFIDAQFQYQSLDLFCAEFVERKKTAANIYQVRISHRS